MHLAEHEKVEEQTPSTRQTYLRVGETRATTNILTPTKRAVLLSTLKSGYLHREKWRWIAYADGRIVSGGTVADLVRDGFMVAQVDKNRRSGTARLTERGNWFARTIADEEQTETEQVAPCMWQRNDTIAR